MRTRCTLYGRCNRPEPDSTDYCFAGMFKHCEIYKKTVQERAGKMRELEQEGERLRRLGGYYK